MLECMWGHFLISTNLLFNSLNLNTGRAAKQSGRFSILLSVSSDEEEEVGKEIEGVD